MKKPTKDPGKYKRNRERMMLGLAISAATLKPGETRTQRELADFCGVTYQRMQQIEKDALLKVRFRLGDIGEWRDLFQHREPMGIKRCGGCLDVLLACRRWLRARGLSEECDAPRDEHGRFMAEAA